MSLILHIFRKDVRHLYPEIALTVALTAAFAWAAPTQWLYSGGNFGVSGGGVFVLFAPLLRILLPIAWLVLISRLIHDESLVGDRQFWITRPYTWPVLLAAKLLFLVVCVWLPFALMQAYLLHHAGLSVAAAAHDLIRYHVRLAACFFLPLVALAAVTSTFARLALSVLAASLYGAVVIAAGSQLLDGRMMVPQIGSFCAILFCLVVTVVLLWQYARRRTRQVRLTLLCLPLALLLIVLVPANALINRAFPPLPESAGPKLAFDPDPLRQQPGIGAIGHFEGRVLLSIPLTELGSSAGLRYKGRGIAATIDTAQGFHWSSPFRDTAGFDLHASRKKPEVSFQIPTEVFDRIRDTPINLHLQIAASIYRTDAAVSATASSPTFSAPGGGVCPLDESGFAANCRYALRPPNVMDVSAEVSDEPCGLDAAAKTTPLPTFIGADERNLAVDFDPVHTSALRFNLPPASHGGGMRSGHLCPGDRVTFTPYRQAHQGQLGLDIHDLILAPYAARKARFDQPQPHP